MPPPAPNTHTHPNSPFPCATPAEVRAALPPFADAVAFQCRNPIHRAHYELFTRALHAPNVRPGAVVLVHATMGPTQEDDIPGLVRYHTYEVLKRELKVRRTVCMRVHALCVGVRGIGDAAAWWQRAEER